MKQLKPFTKISLGLLCLGTLLSLCGYLAGGWSAMKDISQNYYQLQSVTFSNIDSIEVNERISIMPSPDEDFHLYYYRNTHKKVDLLNHQVLDGKLISSNEEQGLVTYQGLLDILFKLSDEDNVEDYQPVLQIPKNSHLEELSGSITGDFYLDKVTIDHFNLSVMEGDLLIEDSLIGIISLLHINGEVEITNSTLKNPTDITDTVGSILIVENGDFKAENIKLEGRHDISNNSGSIDITLHSQTKANLHIDATQNNSPIELPNYANEEATNYLYLYTKNGIISLQ